MKYLLLAFRNSSLAVQTIALVLMLASFSANAQGVLAGTRTGTIQAEAQDDGYMTISGQNYIFQAGTTQVYLNGERVGDEVLDEGLVVRYTLNGEGVLARIEILGPVNMIQALQSN